jgi:hypothetical protein
MWTGIDRRPLMSNVMHGLDLGTGDGNSSSINSRLIRTDEGSGKVEVKGTIEEDGAQTLGRTTMAVDRMTTTVMRTATRARLEVTVHEDVTIDTETRRDGPRAIVRFHLGMTTAAIIVVDRWRIKVIASPQATLARLLDRAGGGPTDRGAQHRATDKERVIQLLPLDLLALLPQCTNHVGTRLGDITMTTIMTMTALHELPRFHLLTPLSTR